uniref:Uncharacterized protein n=1 Tax=Anguilla anguilla TaxID=7936 RepID=A0A0E9PD81_ANGAN
MYAFKTKSIFIHLCYVYKMAALNGQTNGSQETFPMQWR